MLQELWQFINDKILESWQIKTVCSGVISSLAFLLGDFTGPPIRAILVMIILDTATRWAAIAQKETGGKGSIIAGFGVAVILGRIKSDTFRTKFFKKMFSYLVLLIGFNMLDLAAPDVIFGHDFVGVPNTFITTWIVIGELISILENLIEAGVTGLSPLVAWAKRKQDKMTEDQPRYPTPAVGLGALPIQPAFAQQQLLSQIKNSGDKPPV